jgi:hypothetical protein
MAEILFKNDVLISIGSIDKDEDLNPKARINLNPPPADGRCECCGRHISELEPFGGPGDPLVGDFTGALLVKKFRPDGPYNNEAETAVAEALKHCDSDDFDCALEWMIKEYGQEKGTELFDLASAYRSVGAIWECRNCSKLNVNEYFKKLI